MARRATVIVVSLVLVAGCQRSTPLTQTEQALSYLRTGAYEKAIATCDEAIRANPHDSVAYLYRGRAYQFRDNPGDRDRAIAEFTEAIHIAPKDPEAYYSRSIAYRDQGDGEKSEADEKMYRRLDSRIEQYYSQLPDVSPPPPELDPNRKFTDQTPKENEDDLEHAWKTGERRDSATREENAEGKEKESETQFKSRYSLGSEAPKDKPDELDERNRQDDDADNPYLNTPNSAQPDGAYPNNSYPNGLPNSTPRAYPTNPANSRTAPNGKSRAPSQYRPPDAMRGELMRDPWLSDPNGPRSSPWLAQPQAGPYGTGQWQTSPYRSQVQSPYMPRSPFPQQRPRPTGFSGDDSQAAPYAPQDRSYFNGPSSVPTSHLPGAYHTDLNP